MSTGNSPIGIFDSGIGGLTVAKAVMDLLPNEEIIYFGDTARVPYGIKSEETIRRYATQITRFLMQRDVKLLLIACNSVSAVAREAVREEAGAIPVLDVISASTEAALEGGSRKIGVIGTLATIGSGAYEKSLRSRDGQLKIVTRACPLLVPLAEEGWTGNEIAVQTLELYLGDFRDNEVESLILGCTHYPLFTESIRSLFPSRKVAIIDSGDAIAAMASRLLRDLDLQNPSRESGAFECFVTDRPQRFQELAARFLGREIPDVQITELD